MVFDRVKKLVGGGSDKEGSTGGGEGVVMPTNSKVVKKTAKEVDLSRGDVKDAVEKFQEVGAMAYPAIDQRAVRGEGDKSSKPDDDGGPSFLYVIHEDDEVLVIGGAKNIIHTFADRLNMSNTETRAVTVANRIAGDKNGFSEHIVMDDIFIVPKKGGSERGAEALGGIAGRDEDVRGDEEALREVEENGFALQVSEVFDEPLDLDEKKPMGVSYGCEDGIITLTLTPNPNESDGDYRAVVNTEGGVLIPREIAIGLGIEHREVEWERDDERVIGRMEDGSIDEDIEDRVKTALSKDNIEEEIQVHLPGSHATTLGMGEDDEVALYLEPNEDDFSIVLTSDMSDAPTDRTVEIKNIGTGTEMLCFALPEEIADVLDVDDDEERQIEWGLRGEELVGAVVR